MSYPLALALTVGCELPLVGALTARSGLPVWERLAVALGANLFTHGALWTLFPRAPASYALALLLAETLVWLTEAAVYAGFRLAPPGRALLLSGAANLFTTALGLVLHAA